MSKLNNSKSGQGSSMVGLSSFSGLSFFADEEPKKFDKMMNYCFNIFHQEKLKREKIKSHEGEYTIKKGNKMIDTYEILKNVKNLARKKAAPVKPKEEDQENHEEEQMTKEELEFAKAAKKNLEDYPMLINRTSDIKMDIASQARKQSSVSLFAIDKFTTKQLENRSIQKVNKVFANYFRNKDPDSEEIKEISDIIHANRVKNQQIILNSRFFNHTCEKFKPVISNSKNLLQPQQKQFILRGISKTLAPCRIPADYLERRKYYNALFTNQKLMKVYNALPKREKQVLTFKELTEAIMKMTEEVSERVYLLYFYMCTNMKVDTFSHFSDFDNVFIKKNEATEEKMNKTGFKGSTRPNFASKEKMNKTFHKTKNEATESPILSIDEEIEKLVDKDQAWKLGVSNFVGINNIFIELLKCIGIQSDNIKRIQGFFKPTLSQDLKKSMKIDFQYAIPNHEWIKVNIYDNWYFIDPFLGCGYYNKEEIFIEEFNTFYFLLPSSILIDTHLPRKEEDQFLMKPIRPTEFINTHPIDYKIFFDSVGKFNFNPLQPYLPYIIMKPNTQQNILFELPFPIILEIYDIESMKLQTDRFLSFVRSGMSYSIQVSQLERIGVYTIVIKAQNDPKNLSVVSEVARITVVITTQD